MAVTVKRTVEELEKENADLREALVASVQLLGHCPLCGGHATCRSNELTIHHGKPCAVAGMCNEHVVWCEPPKVYKGVSYRRAAGWGE
jgi:hypothetical protein